MEVGRIRPGAASTAVLLTAYHQRGDRSAREQVIEQNLPLVRALARRFSREPGQVEELVQVGAIGLIKAVDGFREERGTALGAYAVPTIVGELRRTIERGRAAVELDEDSLESATAVAELDRSETRALLRDGFRALTRRERRVVALRYYSDWSQERIAAELGLSQAHVSRVLSNALAKMRVVLVAETEEALCDSSRGSTMSGR